MRSDRQGAEHRLRASGSETKTGMGTVAGKNVEQVVCTVAAGSMWTGDGSRCQ